MHRPALEVVATVLMAVLVLFAVDLGVFRSSWYDALLAPESTTATFERTLRTVEARSSDSAHDVLVLGDSRILAAFSPAVANANGGGLRFLSGGVEGTDPRCWFYFLRDADPTRARFHAIVIPLDDYNDDGASLGADDAADRASDIPYVAFRLRESDVLDFPWSFDFLPAKRAALEAAIFHAFALRRDLYDLLANPPARFAALARDRAAAHRTDDFFPGRTGSLSGLHVDANGTVAGLGVVAEPDREPLLSRLMRTPHSSPSYAAYRRRWLGRIAGLYNVKKTRLVFVRIPAAPLVLRRQARDPNAVAYTLGRRGQVTLLPVGLFDRLERPQYFADHDHVNDAARKIFSATLAQRVAHV